jgi:uncharacterized protein
MFSRDALHRLRWLLQRFPAVALLGPRQAGKTTLALSHRAATPDALYLDLELPSARRQLDDPEAFLLAHRHRLLILDEVQRMPGLFEVLRGVIDLRRREGEAAGQFLLLGSASGTLLQQSSESLAGRVATVELTPFLAHELGLTDADPLPIHRLWQRGGFPLSWLAPDDATSVAWREAFITSYLERDIPNLGPRIPATTLRRLWTMLAHQQGGLLNHSQLASSLAVSGQSVSRYVDLLCDLMLVRRLPPWSGNVGKRLVRSPKVYVRDSGLVHALLGLPTIEHVLAHPVAGTSWEGWVIEQLLAAAPSAQSSFFRTARGAEADLVLEFAAGSTWIVEIKRSSAPVASRGFHQAAVDVGASRKLLVAPVPNPYPGREGVEVMGVLAAVAALRAATTSASVAAAPATAT